MSRSIGRTVSERQTHILEAFERCILHTGFHRTSMQDVAREAGMSAGNLYRYFGSKEELVSGLAELDRSRYFRDLAPHGDSSSHLEALIARGQQVLVDSPADRCVKMLEIWAEGSRNPAIARVCRAKIHDIVDMLGGMLQGARDAGEIPAATDIDRLVLLVMTLADGFSMRRAIDPDFDAQEGFDLIRRVIGAATSGALDLASGLDPVPTVANARSAP